MNKNTVHLFTPSIYDKLDEYIDILFYDVGIEDKDTLKFFTLNILSFLSFNKFHIVTQDSIDPSDVQLIASQTIVFLKTTINKYVPLFNLYADGKLKYEVSKTIKHVGESENNSDSMNEMSPINATLGDIETPDTKSKYKHTNNNSYDDTINDPLYNKEFIKLTYNYPKYHNIVYMWLSEIIYEFSCIY